MKAKVDSISSDASGNIAYYVDLNEARVQERILNYLRYGVPGSDQKHGHSIRLQCRVTPIVSDILQSIKEKSPVNYWKTQSDQLRSVIAVGSYVSSIFLNEAEGVAVLDKEFRVFEFVNQIARQVRESELAVEIRRAIYAKSTMPLDLDVMLDELKSAARGKLGSGYK